MRERIILAKIEEEEYAEALKLKALGAVAYTIVNPGNVGSVSDCVTRFSELKLPYLKKSSKINLSKEELQQMREMRAKLREKLEKEKNTNDGAT